MSRHAQLSPSSAHRWMRCPGSVALCDGLPDSSSAHADEGTAAHTLAQRALDYGRPAAFFLGEEIIVSPASRFVVDVEMAEHVQRYVDYVLDVTRAVGGELFVEVEVPLEHITGEKGAVGTSDAVILTDDEIIVIDLKYGRGVEVSAHRNEQLMMYALGALKLFGAAGDFKRARMVVHQPRVNQEPSEWDCSIDELMRFRTAAEHNAALAWGGVTHLHATGVAPPEYFAPSDKACRWCKAKATCSALRDHVLNTVADDFVDITKPIAAQLSGAVERARNSDNAHLGNCMAACDLIEDWIKAVRARVESELLSGADVPGFKLVEGRRGARKWTDPEIAETTLRSMRLKHDEIYEYSLISPTAAERLRKGERIGDRQWNRLQSLITQNDGKPSVAPLSDKRPALVITSAADDFSPIASNM